MDKSDFKNDIYCHVDEMRRQLPLRYGQAVMNYVNYKYGSTVDVKALEEGADCWEDQNSEAVEEYLDRVFELINSRIKPNDYHHVKSITMNVLTKESGYNYNFYVNNSDDTDIILEICDEEYGSYEYYRVTGLHKSGNSVIADKELIGYDYDNQFGIFDDTAETESDGYIYLSLIC